jgi:hypothetical protein
MGNSDKSTKKHYFSYSRLSSFKSCKEQYKITYLDGIRTPCESIEAFMGKCVHATLEWLYQKDNLSKPYVTFDWIVQSYDLLWWKGWHDQIIIPDGHSTTDEFYSIGKRCLSNYYNKYGPIFDEKVVGTEVEVEFEIGGQYYRGIIDRLDQPEPGKYIIHDYKTSKRAKSERAAMSDLQLAMYHIAVEQSFPDAKEIIVKWHFVRSGTEVAISHTRDSIAKFKESLAKDTQNIIELSNSRDNFYPKETMLCNWCCLWEECSAKIGRNPAKLAT